MICALVCWYWHTYLFMGSHLNRISTEQLVALIKFDKLTWNETVKFKHKEVLHMTWCFVSLLKREYERTIIKNTDTTDDGWVNTEWKCKNIILLS